MGRAAASRAGGTADAMDELEFHWGSAYDIAITGGMWTARRRDGRGDTLADPLQKGCGCGSRLTTRRCRSRGTCRERGGNGPATPEHDLYVPRGQFPGASQGSRRRRSLARPEPGGTSEDLVAAIGCQFHPGYGVVLRALLFAADRHQARAITAAAGNAVPAQRPS